MQVLTALQEDGPLNLGSLLQRVPAVGRFGVGLRAGAEPNRENLPPVDYQCIVRIDGDMVARLRFSPGNAQRRNCGQKSEAARNQ